MTCSEQLERYFLGRHLSGEANLQAVGGRKHDGLDSEQLYWTIVKKISKRKNKFVALPKPISANKGDLDALKHDCSPSGHSKIVMLSM